MINSNFELFRTMCKRKIQSMGLNSDDLYFSQFQSGYSAGYMPDYPKRSNNDISFYFDHNLETFYQN